MENFYCLNCLYYFRTKNKLQSHKKVCENKYLCNVIMLSEGTETSELNQYQKSDKASFIIYKDLECIIKNTDVCKNNPDNSYTTKVSKHILSGFLMSTLLSFKSIKNKHDVCRSKDYMKNFCESLREHTMKIIILKE